MKCTILTVGTEILFGSIVNTNAVYLSNKLREIGVDVLYHMTVGDNPARLKEILAHAYTDCDLIITTGGLGPTQDDLTKEMICEYFGEELVCYPDELEKIKSFMQSRGRVMTDNNKKQANFPKNCRILKNPNGTAPGFFISKNGKMIAALPGPPFEMHPMFENELVPILSSFDNGVLVYKMVKTHGIGESSLETKLLPLINGQTDPTFATYASKHEASVRVASKRATREEAEAAVEDAMVKVRELVGEYIYSEEGKDISVVTSELLMENNISISSCESCTGGLFAKTITDISGISKVFDRSLVTYSWKAKNEELGVSYDTLNKYGAVSPEVAKEMAEGLYKACGSDICISVTGLAGPLGDGSDKKVGQVYIGLCFRGETEVYDDFFPRNNRDYIRNGAVTSMFWHIYNKLQKCIDK